MDMFLHLFGILDFHEENQHLHFQGFSWYHMHMTVFMVFFLKAPNNMLNMGNEDGS